VFGVTIGNTITEISQVPGLFALEIDTEQAAEAYRQRIIAATGHAIRLLQLPGSWNSFLQTGQGDA
jgi:arsenite/tail-anchored protein-transporting ATPase